MLVWCKTASWLDVHDIAISSFWKRKKAAESVS
jgi:hypothetical protein